MKFPFAISCLIRSPQIACCLYVSKGYAIHYGTGRTFMPTDPITRPDDQIGIAVAVDIPDTGYRKGLAGPKLHIWAFGRTY